MSSSLKSVNSRFDASSCRLGSEKPPRLTSDENEEDIN